MPKKHRLSSGFMCIYLLYILMIIILLIISINIIIIIPIVITIINGTMPSASVLLSGVIYLRCQPSSLEIFMIAYI